MRFCAILPYANTRFYFIVQNKKAIHFLEYVPKAYLNAYKNDQIFKRHCHTLFTGYLENKFVA